MSVRVLRVVAYNKQSASEGRGARKKEGSVSACKLLLLAVALPSTAPPVQALCCPCGVCCMHARVLSAHGLLCVSHLIIHTAALSLSFFCPQTYTESTHTVPLLLVYV